MSRPLFAAVLAACFLGCGSSTEVDAGSASDATIASDSGIAPNDAGFCPMLSCADLDLGATNYDASTHVLTLVLKSTALDVLSGSVSFSVAKMAMAPSTQSAVLTVSGGKSASANLTPWLTNDVAYFGALSITFVSSCHSTTVIGNLVATASYGPNGVSISAFSCG